MNMAAVLALKKMYGRLGFETSNCFLKFMFAATTPARAGIATGRFHSDLLIGCHAAYVRRRNYLVLWFDAEFLVIAATDATAFT